MLKAYQPQEGDTVNTTTRTAEQTLAFNDYRIITDYAYTVASVKKAQRDVAESPAWMVAANAQDLLDKAQRAEAIRRTADIIGVVFRHPAAWTAAAEGDTDKVSDMLADLARSDARRGGKEHRV